ncbi:MAG: phosphoribosylanthranilate isomerase [Burkholderiaceae bacterium]|nr:phosphoribosylanthranilate isomerase [Burkholderiaceae bacterium]
MTTRIKICGLTQPDDVDAAVAAGADYIGFVCYPPSPRFVESDQLHALASRLPAHVTPVLLFVNAAPAMVTEAIGRVPNACLQFHGEEVEADCTPYARPFWKVARIPTGPGAGGFNLLQFVQQFPAADAILLDAKIDAYGGGGKTFDWTAFPWSHLELNVKRRLVLSGGLTPANVTDGIRTTQPWAVDVSSGVEHSKGVKDPALMQAFCEAAKATAPKP